MNTTRSTSSPVTRRLFACLAATVLLTPPLLAQVTLVKDINPTGHSMGDPPHPVDINGTLFFIADDGSSGVHSRA